ncbi:C39 family peptidase [Candidatus Saccharibacteria bacterium]|nr:C39 family peptidase [Candidatus Saccharibacteria bacterium]
MSHKHKNKNKNKNNKNNKNYQNNQNHKNPKDPKPEIEQLSPSLFWRFGFGYFLRLISRRLGLALVGLMVLQLGLLAGIVGSNTWHYLEGQLELSPVEAKLEIGQALKIKSNFGLDQNFAVETEPSFDYHLELMHTGALGLVDQIVLVPDGRLKTGTDYRVKLNGIAKKFGDKQDLELGFRTQDAPEIEAVDFDQASNVKLDQTLTLKLTEPNNDLSDFQIKTQPEIQFDKILSQDKTEVKFVPKQEYRQTTEYGVEVFDNYKDQLKPVKQYKFQTVREPKLSINQTESLNPNSNLVLSFSEPMNQQETTIQTNLGGYSWLDAQNIKLDLSGITPGNSYDIEVMTGARTEAGGRLEAESPRSFRVRSVGEAYASISPGGYGLPINSRFRVDFSQAVDRASAESRISVAPSFDYHLEWASDSTVLVVPNTSLGYGSEYRVVVGAGVVNLGFGLPSSSGFTGSFVTEERVTILGVPFFYQTMPLSCESAALKMALAYRGISATENQIMSLVGYNPKQWQVDGNQWDDPYQMFVGDVMGSQSAKTGYGVYAPPIAAAAQALGANSSVHYGVSASFIANQIANNNPVVIWGYSYSGQRIDWNANGSAVGAYIGEHARTVIGFRGNPDNPTSFIINDPVSGQLNWTAAQLMANMNIHGNLSNQAVVVY